MIKVSTIFYNLGRFSAAHKLIMVTFCITITVVLGLGMVDLSLVSDPQKLWVNLGGRTNKEQTYFKEKFGAFFRINQVIYELREPDSEIDLFSKEYLLDLYYLQKTIMERKIISNNRTISVYDLCFKPVSDKSCYLPSPLDYWKMDIEKLVNDTDPKETAKCLKSIDGNVTCTDSNGVPIIKEVVFGGLSCLNNPSDCTNECTPCSIKANTLAVTMMLNNDAFTKEDAELWEKEVYEDTINQYNDGTLNYSKYLNEPIININGQKRNGTKITYLAERSIPDELVDETNQNIFVVIVSYLVMFLYISIAIGSFPNLVHSGFIVGICGIFVVGASIISALGLASYFNQGVSMISAEVVPFLILAIGVDNMFIIANANRRAQSLNKSIPGQLGEALKEVGPSISTAAFCEFLAFIVGYITYIPALQSFCLIAAIAVFFDYLFQITVFIAVLAMDEERKKQKRCDIFPFVKIENPTPPRPELVKGFIDKYYIPVLFNPFVKVMVMIIFSALIVMSAVGLSKLDLGLDQQVSLIKDSNTYNFFNDLAKYGEAGPPAYIVLKGINYTNDNDLQILSNMSDTLSKLKEYIQPPVYQWVSSFNQLFRKGAQWGETCGVTSAVEALSYEEKLKFFIDVKIDSKCCHSYGICGETFVKDIIFDEKGRIEASRFRFQHRPLRISDDFINAFTKTRQIVDYFSDKLVNNQSESISGLGSLDDNKKELFAYSLFYVYFEQYTYIRGVAIQNVLLAVGVVYAAVLLIKNARSAFFIFLCCFCTTFDLIGASALLNKLAGGYEIQINAVSVVNLIVCVGLSVEFSVHIMLQFMNCLGLREDRSKAALSIMGSSVIVGIAITKFIGVIVLGFASSTLFTLYYFRMFMCIIVLGFFHGLVFLPVLLSLVGPRASHRTSSYEDSFYSGSLKKIK